MGDLRSELITRARRCGRCKRPFEPGETVYVPGRYEVLTAPEPVCWDCVNLLECEAIARVAVEPRVAPNLELREDR